MKAEDLPREALLELVKLTEEVARRCAAMRLAHDIATHATIVPRGIGLAAQMERETEANVLRCRAHMATRRALEAEAQVLDWFDIHMPEAGLSDLMTTKAPDE